MSAATLAGILAGAAEGRFPPPDGGWTLVPAPKPRDAGVLGLTAHAVIFSDADPEWIASALRAASDDPFEAPLSPFFLTALATGTGRRPGSTDLLTHASPLPGPVDPGLGLREVTDLGHPRVARALLHRDAVRVWQTEGGVLTVGRGVADRWETAIECAPEARGRGLGRRLAAAARALVPPGSGGVWAQVAAGNAQSVRAFLHAGYRPVGAEVLLTG